MLSHIVDGLVLVQNAVDDTRKNASMVITPSNNGESHLGTVVDRQSTNQYEIPVQTILLSDIVDAISARLNDSTQMLIKIDIEGYECNAFLGSSQVLTNQRSVTIVAVIMEVHGLRERCSLEKFLRLKTLFINAGYIPFYLHGQILMKVDVAKPDWPKKMVWFKDKNIIRYLSAV